MHSFDHRNKLVAEQVLVEAQAADQTSVPGAYEQ
jgi:hypothetical protein